MREVTHMVPGRGGWTMLEHDPLPRRAKSVPVRSKPWFAGFNVFERCHASRAHCLKLLACAFVLDNTVAEKNCLQSNATEYNHGRQFTTNEDTSKKTAVNEVVNYYVTVKIRYTKLLCSMTMNMMAR